jgi:hypothetical protein
VTDEAAGTRLHVVPESIEESKNPVFGEFRVSGEFRRGIRKDDLMIQSPVEGQLRSVDFDCLPQSDFFVERMEREYFGCSVSVRLTFKNMTGSGERFNWFCLANEAIT